MEAEVCTKQRCLLCRSEIFEEVKTENISNLSVLSKHLRVIFLLRKVLQVPVSLLARFLASCPNVEGWVGVCERCQGVVTECRQVYQQIVELKRKWVECRLLVVKIVKETADSSEMDNVEDVGLLDIDKEIRTFVENHEFSTWENSFTKGDLIAEQWMMMSKDVDHEYVPETPEDFVGFEHDDVLEEDVIDTYVDYNQETMNDDPLDIDIPVSSDDKILEEEMVNQEKDEDWKVSAPLTRLKKKRLLKKKPKKAKGRKPSRKFQIVSTPKQPQVPKHRRAPERPVQFVDLLPKPPRKGPVEGTRVTICSKAELVETVYCQKKSVEEFISVLESRKETPFTEHQKILIKKSAASLVSHFRSLARKHKWPRSRILSELTGDFVVRFREREPSPPPPLPLPPPPPPPPAEVQKQGIGRPIKHLLDDGSVQTKCYVSGCLQICPTLEGLQAHQNRDHTEEERNSVPETAKIYQCTKCLEVFRWKNSIIKHRARVHNPQKKVQWTGIRVKCLVEGCSKIWLSTKALLQHQETEHKAEELETIPQDAPIHECVHCKEMFINLEKLRQHRKKLHGEGPKKTAICDICGTALSKNYQIEKHQQTNLHCRRLQGLPDPEKSCECQQCGKKFHYPANLVSHIRAVHERKYAEQCDLCGKGFLDKSSLIKHKAKVHRIGDFPCTEEGCGRMFWNRHVLDFHVAYIHRGDGGYFCEAKDCGKKFHSKNKLRNHMNQNHLKGEPGYKCAECGKPFYFSEYLSQHVSLVHRGQKKKRRTGSRGHGSSAVMTVPTTSAMFASTQDVWNMSGQT